MLEWMHWTVPSIFGILGLFGMIIGVNILDVYKPSYARKGFLPMETTRGDRIFICLVSSVIIWFLWLKLIPDVSLLFSMILLAPTVFILMKWG